MQQAGVFWGFLGTLMSARMRGRMGACRRGFLWGFWHLDERAHAPEPGVGRLGARGQLAQLLRAGAEAAVQLQVQLLQVGALQLAAIVAVRVLGVLAVAVRARRQVHDPLCLRTTMTRQHTLNQRAGALLRHHGGAHRLTLHAKAELKHAGALLWHTGGSRWLASLHARAWAAGRAVEAQHLVVEAVALPERLHLWELLEVADGAGA
jgi:hypothetical protein